MDENKEKLLKEMTPAEQRDLLAFLMEDCCNGAPELCAPVIDAVTCGCPE